MDGIWWDIGLWPSDWPEGSALDRPADSEGQKSECQPDAQAHALTAWDEAQRRLVHSGRPPPL